MEFDFEKILIGNHAIAKRVAELGKKISSDYAGDALLAVCILKGSILFFADLIRCLTVPVKIDFIKASSYGKSTSTLGKVAVADLLSEKIKGRRILLVEDIVDSGLTIKRILDFFLKQGASDVRVCTLLDKPDRRIAQVEPDYSGFVIPDEFVVGYGMDFDEKYRNLPYIAVLKEQENNI
ncbi:hypoxanthine phosphoribosyltransferase [Eubacterium sp. 1001713B170207_170306_E7]|uniref:hypoxanthine phosphoribosyltransferase n=1 Tax=Eubacterium sp. 1001713B170207_170306_E7 TaxID=2787097 RepID=UPI00189A2D2B|nr:hypoxanthine phosphoribosyltransferase [Eubacterium sp. 1001713B170207_170306_E7]